VSNNARTHTRETLAHANIITTNHCLCASLYPLPRRSIGMHWGTFPLTDEPIEEPPARLREAMRRKGLPEEGFVALQHGQVFAHKVGVLPAKGEAAAAPAAKQAATASARIAVPS
jgi:hypothetical protein